MKCRLLAVLVPVFLGLVPSISGQLFMPCPSSSATAGTQSGGPSLPVLPDQFVMSVEANIIQKNYTRRIREYYDYPNNRGVLERYSRHTGEIIRTIMDFSKQEAKIVYENRTCEITPINPGKRQFAFMSSQNGTHIRSIKEMLYFSNDTQEVYVDGDKIVRGIPVDHWTTCAMTQLGANFTMDYYFSKNDSYTIDGQRVRIPIRAVLNGTADYSRFRSSATVDPHTFYHIYEFTDFHPGPIKDESIFEVPVGTYCHRNKSSKASPSMPNQFTADVEVFNVAGNRTTHLVTQTIYMDGASKILRVDDSGPMTLMDLRNFGRMPITFIYDYNATGLIYAIDQWERNCTVSKVRSSWHLGQAPPLSWQAAPPPGLAPPIAGPITELMYMDNRDYVYQGQKTWRGMMVETFASYNATTKQVTEVIFHRDTTLMLWGNFWRPFSTVVGPLILLGVYIRTPASGMKGEVTSYMHVYNYKLGHPDRNVFDISPCYEPFHHYTYLGLKIKAIPGDLNLTYMQHEFYAAVRSAIAQAAKVSATRVTSLLAQQDLQTTTRIFVYFKLLDNTLAGLPANTPKIGPTLATAKSNLQTAIASGTYRFIVDHQSGGMTLKNTYLIEKDSLWTMMSSEYPRSPYTSPDIKKYSSGSMAGLGIGMLIVGALLGLGAAYIIYRRIDTSVPYRITQ